ncbi:uncharacterized protein HMPREF1541_05038 [Cyphellophora europaea CBS 101466]|uniref:ATP synthase (E/31 kDa) subunit n=1 Tax=Cyphellophora europaea (strain CBS 101466) TaxID=1220924 RepID=W2RY88_CYPE1|nr:uncharacterized protein HMPREF1541_05038 [Cyphellophora europaea CBS 101466]ETN40758.1 hypothetical protein HMPREF1541_05038 [Cyphellophora europaea CBS 101466]
MSSNHALSDDQVANELKKMTAFIRQEALEKSREIQLKADEEFAIEKSKLVRESTADIDAEYEKKFKQASMSQQITRSTQANKTRLRVLSARQELLDELFEKARGKLGDASKGKQYDDTLKDLILECMYMMGEKKIGLRCRKADKGKVESASKKAGEEYKKNMGGEIEAVIDEKNWPGGVFVLSGSGKIELNNTFEERLRMLETEALPTMRATLFGENENRHFRD